MDISRKLTDVCVLYGDFLNVRYIGVLEALQQGEFPVREKHLYAKTEMVRLLDDTLFKEIDFEDSLLKSVNGNWRTIKRGADTFKTIVMDGDKIPENQLTEDRGITSILRHCIIKGIGYDID